ncbi:Ig-like domain-containing protein [Pseudoroseomonas globiformis]|uniref:Ig-like domain-containing protein n=1 Tax=Teichococcus globiformis TaxID=2307229 RepID=A0ABV7G0P4_9PROT
MASNVQIISVTHDAQHSALGAGQSVALTLNITRAVKVDTDGGTPRLKLSNGAEAVYDAAASAAAGTDKMVFNYTVTTGDDIAALKVQALDLNGATVGTVASAGKLSEPAMIGNFNAKGVVQLADLNGDGYDDIVFRSTDELLGSLVVINSDGHGGFHAAQRYTGLSFNENVAVGDVTGDGVADIVAVSGNKDLVILEGAGDGSFTAGQSPALSPLFAGSHSLAIGDMNGDGHADIAVGLSGTSPWQGVGFLFGDGAGGFHSSNVLINGYSARIVVADLNGDGFDDVISTRLTGGEVDIVWGKPAGQPMGTHSYFFGNALKAAAVGDVTGDGIKDIVLALSDGGLALMKGIGPGHFMPTVLPFGGIKAADVLIADVDGDGRGDIVFSNTANEQVQVLLSQGGGAFYPGQSVAVGSAGRLALGDVNRKGAPDLVMIDGHGAIQVLTGQEKAEAEALDIGSLALAGGLNTALAIDTVAPGIAIDPIAADDVAGKDIVNLARAAAGFSVSGTTEGVEDGRMVKLDFGGVLKSAPVQGNVWTIAFTAADLAGLPNGPLTVKAKVSDGAGNAATPAEGTLLFDVTKPTAPTMMLHRDTGMSDFITSDGMMLVQGLEAGASWEYSLDGGEHWKQGSGSSFVLETGVYEAQSLWVRQTDAAGNPGEASRMMVRVEIDDIVPDMPQLKLVLDTGLPGDGITRDGRVQVLGLEQGSVWQYSTDGGGHWLHGQGDSFLLKAGTYPAGAVLARQTDVAKNTSLAGSMGLVVVDDVPPAEPTIDTRGNGDFINAAQAAASVLLSGDTDAGTMVTLTYGGFSRAAEVDGTRWSYLLTSDDIKALGQGSVKFGIVATDAAGNESSNSERLFIDTVAPAVPSGLVLAAGSDSGDLDGHTAVVTPTITGRGEDGSIITLFDQNGTVLGFYKLAKELSWSITLPTMEEGSHFITAVAEDRAGNVSEVSAPLSLTIDTMAPEAAVISGLAPASDTGFSGDGVTAVRAPVITGLAEAGTLVTLFGTDGETVLGEGRAGVDGAWSIASTELAVGLHSLKAVATDAAGNSSVISAGFPLEIVEFDLPVVSVSRAGGHGQVQVSLYKGDLPDIRYQFDGSDEGEAVAGTQFNDLLKLGAGDNAADAGDGHDVLMGGTGSNFLLGGAGRDTFILDARGALPSWSTIADWEQGEEVTLWGWRAGTSTMRWEENQGAEGWRGATLHADLNGDGQVETTITFTGLTVAEAPQAVELADRLWFA